MAAAVSGPEIRLSLPICHGDRRQSGRHRRAVDAAWTAPDGYARLMLNPGADNAVYLEPREVTQELVMSYATGSGRRAQSEDRRDRLAWSQAANRRAPAFAASGLDRAVITANLEGIRDLFKASGLAAEISAGRQGRRARRC